MLRFDSLSAEHVPGSDGKIVHEYFFKIKV